LRIGVKHIAGGVFSSHAIGGLKVGDDVEVMTPMGHFTTDIDPTRPRHRAAIVAGSGITPVLSIIQATLDSEPESEFTLIFGNRTTDAVMFLDELADLKDRFPDRLAIFHVLSREPRDSQLLSGRLDLAKLDELLTVAVDVRAVDDWFLCGPIDVIDAGRAALRDLGVPDANVHFELFYVATTNGAVGQLTKSGPEPTAASAGPEAADVTIVLAGRSTSLSVPAGKDVLHSAMAVRPDVPYGCTNGMCGTCRAKLLEGDVYMDHCYALDQAELDNGFVLTCQAKPRTERVVLDYDA
jgi:ring-1,2-phenylacetyl-CoA epoxidase subunit PaaE